VLAAIRPIAPCCSSRFALRRKSFYRLAQAAEARRVSESRHFRSKLVFQVR
jgi:hypothetical protein